MVMWQPRNRLEELRALYENLFLIKDLRYHTRKRALLEPQTAHCVRFITNYTVQCS